MTWRKTTQDEVQEIQEFVDFMKRGQTPPTGDSLLETLRQIHDRRDVPVPDHRHRDMLRQRLRRQMAERDGHDLSEEAIPLPAFMTPKRPKSLVLKWAVAASVLVHVGFGVVATNYIQFDPSFVASALNQPDEEITILDFSETKPLVAPRFEPPVAADARRRGVSTPDAGPRPVSQPTVADRPSTATVFVPGPPTAPVLAPMIAPAATPGADGLADRNLPTALDMPALRPPEPDEKRPMSDVAGLQFERDVDVKPRVLNRPKPRYSVEALQYQIEGIVRLSVVFAADGSIQDVRVVRGLGWGLDDAAIEAVRRYRFTPALKNGLPVSIRSTVDVRFELR